MLSLWLTLRWPPSFLTSPSLFLYRPPLPPSNLLFLFDISALFFSFWKLDHFSELGTRRSRKHRPCRFHSILFPLHIITYCLAVPPPASVCLFFFFSFLLPLFYNPLSQENRLFKNTLHSDLQPQTCSITVAYRILMDPYTVENASGVHTIVNKKFLQHTPTPIPHFSRGSFIRLYCDRSTPSRQTAGCSASGRASASSAHLKRLRQYSIVSVSQFRSHVLLLPTQNLRLLSVPYIDSRPLVAH